MEHPSVTADGRESLIAPRIIAIAAYLWLLVGTFFLTDAACDFFILLILGGSGVFIGLFWLTHSAARPTLLRSQSRFWWLTVPAAGVLGLVLLVSDWGLVLRVGVCEGTLSNFVEGVSAGAQPDRTPRWVGLFFVEDVKVYQGGVYLYTSHSFLNRHGIAYLPPGTAAAPRMRIRHLFGPWYNFEWKF